MALMAPSVNNGLINAKLGQINLSSGTEATLDVTGDGLLNVILDPSVRKEITNDGEISAGYVRIGAGDAADLVNSTINLNGVVEATGFGDKSGSVDVLTSGELNVDGVVKAVGTKAGQTGGTIKLLGDSITLNQSAKVDASGVAGGGEILIGGGFEAKALN